MGGVVMNPEKQKNVDFFLKKRGEWLKNPLWVGKFLVIHGEEMKGVYDTFSAALSFASSQLPIDEFVVQQLIDESAQVNFYSAARLSLL